MLVNFQLFSISLLVSYGACAGLSATAVTAVDIEPAKVALS